MLRLRNLLFSLVITCVFTAQLHPFEALANDLADLIVPNPNFLLNDDEVQLIKSLEPLRVMIDDNFIPLSSYDTKTGTFEGLSVDLFRHIADKLGIKYKFLHDSKLSWADKVELFEKQQIDLLMPTSFTEERSKKGVFTNSFYDTYYGAIVKKSGSIRIMRTQDLASYKIGVTKSSAIIPFIQSTIPNAKITHYANQIELYQGVRNGEVDVALQNRDVFHDDRFNLEFVDLVMPYTIPEYPRRYAYYLGKTEQHQKLATIINRYMTGTDYSRLVSNHVQSEDELILRYNQQKFKTKMLVFGIAGSLTLLVLLGLAYRNHVIYAAKMAAGLEQLQLQKENLQKSEEKFRSLFDNSRDALMIIEPPSWKFTSANQASVDMFWAKDESDFILRGPWDFSPELQPDGRSSKRKAKEIMETVVRDGYHFFEWTHRRIGGEEFKADVLLTRVEDGGKLMLQASIRDVTDRKRAEEALEESQKRLRDIIDFLPDATLAIDLEKRIIIWNRAIEEMTGVPAAEMIGKGDYAYTIPFYGEARPQLMDLVFEDQDKLAARYLKVNREGDSITAEVFCPAMYKNKGAWIFVKASPLRDSSGNIIGAIESIRDITEMKRSETIIAESREKFRCLSDAAFEAIFISENGRCLEQNKRAEEIFGYSAEESEGMLITELIVPDERDSVIQIVSADCEFPFEVTGLRKDGSTFPALICGNKMNFKGRAVRVTSVNDITEIKKAETEKIILEQQFHQAQKLESLGVLAGGIAHDFNNILTVIMGHCYIARQDPESAQDYKASFEQIEAAGSRAADLCRQMLTYAGKSPLIQTRINLWLLVDEVTRMLQSAIKKNVAIVLDLNQRIPNILGDSAQIQQIVMNLIINAAEAIGDASGTIRISLTKETIEADHNKTDFFGTVILAGIYACLEVTDNGSGMNEETQKRIFEPFYTTKSTGRGLGMSAISGIIKAHNGMLQLKSAPGLGTSFRILFPVPYSTDSVQMNSIETVPTNRVSGTILLVEDELVLREMGTALLETLGLTAITAEHGLEALEVYRKRSSEIDLILLDLIMPVMGGSEVYRELRKINATLPIIICSGYSAESLADTIDSDQYAEFVNKPYNPNELRDLMIRMMDQ